MNNPIHPSIESLSAFLDNELAPGDVAGIRSHVEGCAECREQVQAFGALGDLARSMDEQLPGEAYWKDLPDRILIRIGAERVPAPAPASSPSLWQRLWNPTGGWRLAVGGLVSAVLAVSLWFVANNQKPPVPAPSDTAQLNAPAPITDETGAVYTPIEESSFTPPMNPKSYSKRVVMSLGGRNNLGTPLDIVPGQAAGYQLHSRIGSQVSNTLPALGPEGVEVTNGVVSYGCGENPVETAFLAAVAAEQSGDYRLAAQGYDLLRRSLPTGSWLRQQAEYRLMYLIWQQRMQSTWAEERARTIDQLNAMANRSYQTWQQSQQNGDCTKAWCVNRVLLKLAPEVASSENLQATVTRVQQLNDCAQ